MNNFFISTKFIEDITQICDYVTEIISHYFPEEESQNEAEIIGIGKGRPVKNKFKYENKRVDIFLHRRMMFCSKKIYSKRKRRVKNGRDKS